MSNELTVQNNNDIITFDDEKIGLIKRTIAKGATDDELALFMHQAQRTGLDPLAKQIYFQKYNTKSGPQIAIITGIDGYRLVAARTGLYAGNDAPEYEGRILANFYKDEFDAPVKATVTVWKIVGQHRVSFSASAYWEEYYPGEPKGHMWKKMPHVMLAKCAESAALRKAFPADLSGVYTQEEMGQAEWFDEPKPTRGVDWNIVSETIEHDEVPLTGRDDHEMHITTKPASKRETAVTYWSADFLNYCAEGIARYTDNPHKAKNALKKQFATPPQNKAEAKKQFDWLKDHAAERDTAEIEAAQDELFPADNGAYAE